MRHLERWLPVVGYEGLYDVSDRGQVRSLDRRVRCRGGATRLHRGRILRCTLNRDGYLTLSISFEGITTSHQAHRLVLAAFIGPCPTNHEARHLNGIPADCRLGNLVWGTGVENQADRVRHGTSNRGEQQGRSKLTEADVRSIRRSSDTQRAIAAQFGIHQTQVSHIRMGKNWSWLK